MITAPETSKKKRPFTCDCGSLGDKHEAGGGWSCASCREFVARITGIIEQKIAIERETIFDDAKRKIWCEEYYKKNRTRLLEYSRFYRKNKRKRKHAYEIRENVQTPVRRFGSIWRQTPDYAARSQADAATGGHDRLPGMDQQTIPEQTAQVA